MDQDSGGRVELRHLLRHVSEGSQDLLRALTSRDAQRREEIAKRVLEGFASCPGEAVVVEDNGTQARYYARVAVEWADALIEVLDERALEDAVKARDVRIDAGPSK